MPNNALSARRSAGFFCVVLAFVSCQLLARDAPAGSGRSDETPASAPYAYVTGEALVLIRGTKELRRLPRLFEPVDPAQNKVVWSQSGDYVVVLGDGISDPDETELIYIDSQTGKVGRIPCAMCTDLTPVGDNDMLVTVFGTERTTYLRFGLESPGRGTPVDLNLLEVSSQANLRSFLISGRDYVLTHQGMLMSSEYKQHVQLARFDGTVAQNLGSFTSNEYMHVAADTGNAGFRVALAINPIPGLCLSPFPIFVLDDNRQVTLTDMTNAEPPGYVPNIQGGMEVNDLWWGSDRHFHATIESWTCDSSHGGDGSGKVRAHVSAPWRLDGSQWEPEGLGPATMLRRLDADTRIVLLIPDCLEAVLPQDPTISCNTGKLYRERGKDRQIVDDDVLSISTPPGIG